MAALKIPFPDSPAWEQKVQLQGVTYTLRARWNDRMGAWTLDIATREDESIVRSIRLAADYPLLNSEADGRLPNGELFAVQASGEPAQQDPGRSAFSDGSFVLVFQDGPDE